MEFHVKCSGELSLFKVFFLPFREALNPTSRPPPALELDTRTVLDSWCILLQEENSIRIFSQKEEDGMSSKEMTQKVLRELAAERASHGHGEASLIDRRMNKAKGYLGRIIRGDLGLTVETLFEALEVLEVDPADFFGRVTGARVCPDRLLRRLERRAANGGPSVLDRFEIMVAEDSIEVSAGFDDPPPIDDLAGHLDGLDEELFSYPKKALKSAEAAVLASVHRLGVESGRENLEFVCRALGALAATYRVQARFGPAARSLRIGFRLCEAGELRKTRAELMLRTCYLVGDQGEYELAVELARRATDTYLRLRDDEGLGKAFVVRAVMDNRRADPASAIEGYLLGLEYLSETLWYGQCACFHGLARIYAAQGVLEDARYFVAKAVEVHRTEVGQNWLRLVWLRGDIALEIKDFESAERLFRKASAGFSELEHPLEIALVSLRLAKTLLMANRIAELRTLAAEMMRLLKPLERHKIAASVVYEFTCAALKDQVSMKLLDSLCRKLEGSAPRSGAL